MRKVNKGVKVSTRKVVVAEGAFKEMLNKLLKAKPLRKESVRVSGKKPRTIIGPKYGQ